MILAGENRVKFHPFFIEIVLKTWFLRCHFSAKIEKPEMKILEAIFHRNRPNLSVESCSINYGAFSLEPELIWSIECGETAQNVVF